MSYDLEVELAPLQPVAPRPMPTWILLAVALLLGVAGYHFQSNLYLDSSLILVSYFLYFDSAQRARLQPRDDWEMLLAPCLAVLMFVETALVTAQNIGWGDSPLSSKAFWMAWVFPWLGLLNQDLQGIPTLRNWKWLSWAVLLLVFSYYPLRLFWPISEPLPTPLLHTPALAFALLLGIVRNQRRRPWPAWSWSGSLSVLGFVWMALGIWDDSSTLESLNSWHWFRFSQSDWLPGAFCLMALGVLGPWLRLCEVAQKSRQSWLAGLLSGAFLGLSGWLSGGELVPTVLLGLGVGLLVGALDRFSSGVTPIPRRQWVARHLRWRSALGVGVSGMILWLTLHGLTNPKPQADVLDLANLFPSGRVLAPSELELWLERFRNPQRLREAIVQQPRKWFSHKKNSPLTQYGQRTWQHLFESAALQFLGQNCWNTFHVCDLKTDGSDIFGFDEDWWRLENRRAELELHRYYYTHGHLPKNGAGLPTWVKWHMRRSGYRALVGDQYAWDDPWGRTYLGGTRTLK